MIDLTPIRERFLDDPNQWSKEDAQDVIANLCTEIEELRKKIEVAKEALEIVVANCRKENMHRIWRPVNETYHVAMVGLDKLK